jgi:hypothetical protein
MIKVKIFVESGIAHTHQIYTGLCMLRDKGVIDLQFVRGNLVTSSSAIVRAQIENKNICFDLSDSCEFQYKELLDSSDVYFKRMLLKENEGDKILPFGLNYPVLYKNDHLIQRGYLTGGWMGFARSLARRNVMLSKALNINISHNNSSVEDFERLPLLNHGDRRVIFYCKLWNPDRVSSDKKKNQRIAMNDIRIRAVSMLRKELGSHFMGGVQLDDYSKKVAGDSLVKDNTILHKRTYLANLRRSHIGIATEGLEESIGFKFSEYIAMSMAIVSNPVHTYSLPGNFTEGKNYLPYKNAEECVSQCVKLREDNKLFLDMSVNNMQYYNNFLSPDKVMLNCLVKVLAL